MPRADAERLFRMACAAFPRGDVVLTEGGVETAKAKKLSCARPPLSAGARKEAAVFSDGGKLFYRVQLPLPPSHLLALYLRAEDYSSAAQPMLMLDSLAQAAARGAEGEGAERAPRGESQLLNNLLYTDTQEMKVYTFLLAEEQGKSLEIPRAVCVVAGAPAKLGEAALAASRFRGAGEQDICGVTSEGRLVICRCLEDDGRSVKSQLDGYLRALAERIETRCGFRPTVMAGTYARQPEEYRLSLEAALIAGEWAKASGAAGGVVYASDYILEYTFQKTEPARLRHFLAPYAEKLRAEPELAATAEALIANDMNVILTAEKMYVHRNTVTLRAARLRELLGIDPLHKDTDKFLLMLVCAYIRRYC